MTEKVLDLFNTDNSITSSQKQYTNEIEFRSSGTLTLGVEVELQLIDKQSFNLAPRSEELLKAGEKIFKLKPEFYLSTVEVNTDKCENVQQIEADLKQSFASVDSIACELGIQLATTGCHPFSRYADCVITPSQRYHELIDRNQWLTRRMTVYGLHVHIGMKNSEECIRFNNFFLHFLPHLLALSASSPFWQGDDTGLASCRPTTYESLPTAGSPYQVKNWHEFEYLYYTLKQSNAISSLKDLWWDLRPSPAFGTLEIRVCDGPATLAEATAITAFIHLLAHWFQDHGSWIEQVSPPSHWMMRENKWRVMRYGLDAELVSNTPGGVRIYQDIEQWIERLSDYTENLHYQPYIATIRDILAYGNSSTRQRNIFNATNSLEEVVKYNIKEFIAGARLWSDIDMRYGS
jgi:carboxylate-amine ligase